QTVRSRWRASGRRDGSRVRRRANAGTSDLPDSGTGRLGEEPALDALALAVVEARALPGRVPEPLEGGSAALEVMWRVLVEGAQRVGAIPGTAAAQREDPAREVGRQAPRELGEVIHHPARDLVGVDQRRAAPLDAEIVERHRGGNRERLLRPQRSAQGVA